MATLEEAMSEVKPGDNILKSISEIVAEWDLLDAEQTTNAARAAEIKARMNELKMKTLPELLRVAGQRSLTDADTGRVLELELLIDGSLSIKDEAKRQEQLKYIEEQGGSSLIKTTVSLEFDKGEEERAKRAVAMLVDLGYQPSVKMNIHASTLAAWGRDKIKNGIPFEPQKAGLYVRDVVEPTLPAKPKVIKVRGRK